MEELEEYAKKVAEKMGFKDLGIEISLDPSLKSDGKIGIKFDESFIEKIYDLRWIDEAYKKPFDYLPHKVEIRINPSINEVEERKYIVRHELGHYLMARKHEKIYRMLGMLNIPFTFLRNVDKRLPEVVNSVLAFLTALTLTGSGLGYFPYFSCVPPFFALSCLDIPYLAREFLADYYGKKYKI